MATSTTSQERMRGTGRVFSGWWVVASVFVLFCANAGFAFYGLAVYLDAITAEAGFSTGSVSLATSMFFVIGALVGRLAAGWIERGDVRVIVALGAVVGAASLAMLGRVATPAGLYVTYGFFAVGYALCGLVPGTTLVTRWFHVRRSLALSVASTGLSVGGLLVTPLASRLIDRRGLEDAAPVLAVAFLALNGVALLAMWPRPELRGEVPDGHRFHAAAGTSSAAPSGASYDDAVRTRVFWTITIGFGAILGAQVGGIAHLAKLGTERIDRPTGALAVSVLALSSVVGRLIGGWVATRAPLSVMTVVLACWQALTLLSLAFADGRAALLVSASLMGASVGNLLMLHALTVADTFGVMAYARIFAYSQLLTVAGIAVGPFLLGALHDSADYRVAFIAGATLSAAGATVAASGWFGAGAARRRAAG